jgi:hypothetical protein
MSVNKEEKEMNEPKKKEETAEEWLRRWDREEQERERQRNVQRERDFAKHLAIAEQLLANAKKTQSSSEGYSLRAIGIALVEIARELHKRAKG